MKHPAMTTILIALLVYFGGCSQSDRRAGETAATEAREEFMDSTDERLTVIPAPVPTPAESVEQDLAKVEGRRMLNRTVFMEHALASPDVALTAGRADAQMEMLYSLRPPSEAVNREQYDQFEDHPVKRVLQDPVSTFSIDVDTGSYANVRRMLNDGQLPVRDAVRAEELINYFSYDYPVPADPSTPFALYREIAPTPWNPGTYLLHIGIKGFDVASIPPANLVFLVDVSGSMRSPDKLDLLKSSLAVLTRRLDRNDRVAIVVYEGASGVVLEPTSGDHQGRILAALEQLSAGGSTNGGAGIRLAYAMAEQSYIDGGINRVLLATDGDFNVGTVDIEQLKDLVTEKRASGISLSTLGFGTGNYNDHLMEQLADIGNGNYAYIDTLNEARKVLVDEMNSTMLTIARDVKIQIEFNPRTVSEYRLLGYENRALNREDFNNDKVDAGEIGAGHTVTAIYEIALAGGAGQRMDPLRYQSEAPAGADGGEIAFLRLRYKDPEGETSRLLEWPVVGEEIIPDPGHTSDAFRFAAAVAAFAQNLRGGTFTGDFGYGEIRRLAMSARGDDPYGYRSEFISLVNAAESLAGDGQRISALGEGRD